MTSFEVPVRWQDLDALGHVNHAVYLSYFEEQRDSWLHEHLTLSGNDYVVVRVEIDYAIAVSLRDGPVTVQASCANIGNSSVTIAATMRTRKGDLCATSRTIIALWDPDVARTRQLTAPERATLQALAAPDVTITDSISPIPSN